RSFSAFGDRASRWNFGRPGGLEGCDAFRALRPYVTMKPGRDGGGGRFRAALVALFVAAACNGGDAGRGDRDADRTAGGNTGGDSGACSSDDPCDAPLICRAGLCVAENDSGVPSAGAAGAPSGDDPGAGGSSGSAGHSGEAPEFVYGVDRAATLARAGLSAPDALVPHEGTLVADISGHTFRDLDVSGWVDIQAD